MKKRPYIEKLEKLSPKDGDVIIVRASGNGMSGIFHLNEELIRLKHHLEKTNRPRCTILLVGKDTKVECLSPETMLKFGWARVMD